MEKKSNRLKPLDSDGLAQVLLGECLDQTNRVHLLEKALTEENYAKVAEIMGQLEISFGKSVSEPEKAEKSKMIPIAARAPRRT